MTQPKSLVLDTVTQAQTDPYLLYIFHSVKGILHLYFQRQNIYFSKMRRSVIVRNDNDNDDDKDDGNELNATSDIYMSAPPLYSDFEVTN